MRTAERAIRTKSERIREVVRLSEQLAALAAASVLLHKARNVFHVARAWRHRRFSAHLISIEISWNPTCNVRSPLGMDEQHHLHLALLTVRDGVQRVLD